VAVASAGPYASLHFAPDRQPRQYLTTQFFTGRMPFLPPNQQRQSTEGTNPAQTAEQIETLLQSRLTGAKVAKYYSGCKLAPSGK